MVKRESLILFILFLQLTVVFNRSTGTIKQPDDLENDSAPIPENGRKKLASVRTGTVRQRLSGKSKFGETINPDNDSSNADDSTGLSGSILAKTKENAGSTSKETSSKSKLTSSMDDNTAQSNNLKLSLLKSKKLTIDDRDDDDLTLTKKRKIMNKNVLTKEANDKDNITATRSKESGDPLGTKRGKTTTSKLSSRSSVRTPLKVPTIGTDSSLPISSKTTKNETATSGNRLKTQGLSQLEVDSTKTNLNTGTSGGPKLRLKTPDTKSKTIINDSTSVVNPKSKVLKEESDKDEKVSVTGKTDESSKLGNPKIVNKVTSKFSVRGKSSTANDTKESSTDIKKTTSSKSSDKGSKSSKEEDATDDSAQVLRGKKTKLNSVVGVKKTSNGVLDDTNTKTDSSSGKVTVSKTTTLSSNKTTKGRTVARLPPKGRELEDDDEEEAKSTSESNEAKSKKLATAGSSADRKSVATRKNAATTMKPKKGQGSPIDNAFDLRPLNSKNTKSGDSIPVIDYSKTKKTPADSTEKKYENINSSKYKQRYAERRRDRLRKMRLFTEDSDQRVKSSHFIVYGTIGLILLIVMYVMYQKRQKILALIVEGRRQRGNSGSSERSRRGSGGVAYKPLSTKEEPVEERPESLQKYIY